MREIRVLVQVCAERLEAFKRIELALAEDDKSSQPKSLI